MKSVIIAKTEELLADVPSDASSDNEQTDEIFGFYFKKSKSCRKSATVIVEGVVDKAPERMLNCFERKL